MSPEWINHIESEMKLEYGIKLKSFITEERKKKDILPEPHHVFEAFNLCPYWDLKVIILGSEPSTSFGFSNGLSFSSLKPEANETLLNILKEVRQDIYPEFENKSFTGFPTNNLSLWAKQGVLLLNVLLTTEKGVQLAHKGVGWEQFTINTLKFLNSHPNRVVYLLWGKGAQEYKQYID